MNGMSDWHFSLRAWLRAGISTRTADSPYPRLCVLQVHPRPKWETQYTTGGRKTPTDFNITKSIVNWWIDCLIDWLICWLVCWLVRWFIDWLIGWLVGWLMLSPNSTTWWLSPFSPINQGGGRGWLIFLSHLSNVKQHLNVTWIMSYLQWVQLPGSLLWMEGIQLISWGW